MSQEEFIQNSKNIQIDRINPKGHYTEDNCRLINLQGNARNKINRVVKNVLSAEGDYVMLNSDEIVENNLTRFTK